MSPRSSTGRSLRIGVLAASLLLASAASTLAQDAPPPAAPAPAAAPAQADEPKPRLDLYGFAMLDFGFNFDTINPNWTDTMRVTLASAIWASLEK